MRARPTYVNQYRLNRTCYATAVKIRNDSGKMIKERPICAVRCSFLSRGVDGMVRACRPGRRFIRYSSANYAGGATESSSSDCLHMDDTRPLCTCMQCDRLASYAKQRVAHLMALLAPCPRRGQSQFGRCCAEATRVPSWRSRGIGHRVSVWRSQGTGHHVRA